MDKDGDFIKIQEISKKDIRIENQKKTANRLK